MNKEAVELGLPKAIVRLLSGGDFAEKQGTPKGSTDEATPAKKPDGGTEALIIAWFALCQAGVENAKEFVERQRGTE